MCFSSYAQLWAGEWQKSELLSLGFSPFSAPYCLVEICGKTAAEPGMLSLSTPLNYQCSVDGCSCASQETLDSFLETFLVVTAGGMLLTSSKRSPWVLLLDILHSACYRSKPDLTHYHAEIKVKEPAVLNDTNASNEEVTCVYLLMTSLSHHRKSSAFYIKYLLCMSFPLFFLKDPLSLHKIHSDS